MLSLALLCSLLRSLVQLKDARRDIGLVKLFPILCEIVEVHPITEEVVVKLSATSKHMRNTGYPNEDKTQQAKFFEGIFHRDYAATVNYYFTIYSSSKLQLGSYSDLQFIVIPCSTSTFAQLQTLWPITN